ncbi:MAG TPA: DUF2252 family protein [Puia sp.]|nr:DUF2252 family protein [Puia sp.]
MPTIPERIKEFNKDRLPQYTALKYQMMAESAFRFFRGTCHLFYQDLAKNDGLPKGPLAWICGDLHLENFGSYKGDNRLEYFDLNDFDEAVLSPVTWEISRMVTSILVGFGSLKINMNEAKDAASLFLKTYSATLAKGKSKYIEPETAKGIVKLFLKNVASRKQKELIRQRAALRNGKLNFVIDSVHLYKIDKKLKNELLEYLAKWMKKNMSGPQYKYKVLDTAFRVAGTGSVGVKRYVFLVEKMQVQKKYLLVDMKQALTSSVQPWLQTPQPTWATEAERVVAVQGRMQNVSPAFLSSVIFKNDPYVLKEMQPIADKIDFLVIKEKYKYIERVIEDMATLTASAQLRSTGRQGSAIGDELIAFGQDTNWQKNILDYALQYSKQVKKDYAEFAIAYKQKYFS